MYFCLATIIHCVWRLFQCKVSFAISSDVYSFEEEEAVLDPNISEHLSHFGIDMLQMQQRVKGSCVLHLSFLSPIINMSLTRSGNVPQVLWKLPGPSQIT